jgi:iron complex outermembrane receptor protein
MIVVATLSARPTAIHRVALLALTAALLSFGPALAAELEEITVTAQKREQSLQDVPITITAVDGDTLDAYGIDDLFEVANIVPGMVFSRAPDDGLALTFRGLGTPARTQSFDQSVALFQDGMFIGKGRMYSATFFDVERMEFIKGTQSTLLGKNSSLGAISVITRKPGDTLGGFARVSGEFENGGVGFDGALDIPLGDSAALRVAAHYVDKEGWVENLLTGSDVPADEDLGLRATLVASPTDRLTITAALQNSTTERQGNGFQYIDNGDYFPPPAQAIYGESVLDDQKTAICPECPKGESHHDTDINSAHLTFDYDFGGNVLTSVTSWSEYDLKFFDDFDFGNAFDEVTFAIFDPGTVNLYSTYFERDEEYEQISQEFRLTSPAGEKFEYVVGAFFFNSDWESSEQQNWSTPNFPPPEPGNLFNGPFTNNFTQETQTISAFGQGTLNFSDSFRASLGLRYTDETKDVVFTRVQGTPATLWNTIINPPFDKPLQFDDDFLNGNLSLQWDASDSSMLYAAFSVGSKTGGFAESAEVGSGDPALPVEDFGSRVKSETATNIELGGKFTLADGAATLNIAVFKTEVDDFQETSFQVLGGQAFFLTRNIDVESTGVEVEGLWQVADSFRLQGDVTYADSRNVEDDTQLAQAPKYTGSLGFVVATPVSSWGEFTASGFVRYRDDMVSQINETFPSDSLTTVDFTIGIGDIDGGWRLNLVAQNVFDEVSADFSGPPAAPIGAIFGAPPGDQGITSEAPSQLRSLWLQASYHF